MGERLANPLSWYTDGGRADSGPGIGDRGRGRRPPRAGASGARSLVVAGPSGRVGGVTSRAAGTFHRRYVYSVWRTRDSSRPPLLRALHLRGACRGGGRAAEALRLPQRLGGVRRVVRVAHAPGWCCIAATSQETTARPRSSWGAERA